jgi:hypothetical protein
MRCAAKSGLLHNGNFSEGALTLNGFAGRPAQHGQLRSGVHPQRFGFHNFGRFLGMITEIPECFCALSHPQ